MAFAGWQWTADVPELKEVSVEVDEDVNVRSEDSLQNSQEAPPKK